MIGDGSRKSLDRIPSCIKRKGQEDDRNVLRRTSPTLNSSELGRSHPEGSSYTLRKGTVSREKGRSEKGSVSHLPPALKTGPTPGPRPKPERERGAPTGLWRPPYSKPYGKELFFSTPPAPRFPARTLGAVRGPERGAFAGARIWGFRSGVEAPVSAQAIVDASGCGSGPAAQLASAGARSCSASPGGGNTRRSHPGKGRGGSGEDPPPPGKVPLSGHEGVSSPLSPPDRAARRLGTR
uniref:Uncharacterized protein n=1 Tax=Sphaerodactylus townsendi TaxID=933632 RepID=A0ACB8ECG5_9SAUR